MLRSVESFGISDIGLARSNNEDVWGELLDEQFFILADGMGGHRGGEVAAKETVLHLSDAVDRFCRSTPEPTVEAAEIHLRRSIVQTNHWIRMLGDQHRELSGMGSTLCSLWIIGKTAIYAHVGDSRIYRFRETLERLTDDHSLKGELLARGELTEKNAETFPYKNVLTRAMGTAPKVEPEIRHTTVLPGDIFLLCSDGLHDPISDPIIEKILQHSTSLKEAAIELVESAKSAGGGDNITALMIKIA